MSIEERLADLESSGMIEMPTFQQILDMDDDEEEREFSKTIVIEFFEQAKTTFVDMENALKDKDLAALSALGHFLKGSSATLGLIKVRDSCEKIQHYGAHKDESGNNDEPSDQVCLDRLEGEISLAKSEYQEVEKELRRFYNDA